MTKLIVEKSKFLYIAKFVSNEQARFYLTGVYFENDGTITATDGRCLGTLKNAFTKDGDFDSFILPTSKDLISALKKDKSETFELELLDERKTKIVCGCMSLSVDLIDSSYPDYKRVIPENETKQGLHVIGINAMFLAKFTGYTKNNNQIKLFFGETSADPVLVKNEKIEDFTGVIMPVRI